MSVEVASAANNTNPLQSLLSVHQDHSLDNAAKENLVKEIIFADVISSKQDLLSFLLIHREAAPELLVPAVQAIEHYSQLFIDIIQSSNLLSWISWLSSFNGSSGQWKDPLTSAALSMIRLSWKLNIDHRPVPLENKLAVLDYGLLLLASNNLAVAEQASRVVQTIITRDYQSEFFPVLKQHVLHHQHDGTVIFRFLSLCASISRDNEEIAKDCVQKGGFSLIAFKLCQSSDILLAINALDILNEFASSRMGLDDLCRETILDWLITISCGSEGSEVLANPLLESEGLRVLGQIFRHAANRSSQLVSKINRKCLDSFLSAVYRYLSEGQEVEKLTGLGLISDFSMISVQTISILQSHRSGTLLQSWVQILNSSKVELCAAALTAFVKLFDQSEEHYLQNSSSIDDAIPSMQSTEWDAAEREKITEFKKALFSMIGEAKGVRTVQYLLKAAKQPVPVLRNAAMDLMRAIVQQGSGGWGLRVLFNNGFNPTQSEFWVYLKDRTTEYSKEGKDFKFALIQAVFHSTFHELLGEEIVTHLKIMNNQGAYYMPPRLEELETL